MTDLSRQRTEEETRSASREGMSAGNLLRVRIAHVEETISRPVTVQLAEQQ